MNRLLMLAALGLASWAQPASPSVVSGTVQGTTTVPSFVITSPLDNFVACGKKAVKWNGTAALEGKEWCRLPGGELGLQPIPPKDTIWTADPLAGNLGAKTIKKLGPPEETNGTTFFDVTDCTVKNGCISTVPAQPNWHIIDAPPEKHRLTVNYSEKRKALLKVIADLLKLLEDMESEQ